MSGIASLALSLLSKTQAPAFDRVQNVILPSHQQDGPDDLPQCKGFGLVVLSNTEDVETLLREWPWNANARPARPDDQAVHEAAKFGLRTLPRRRWDELKEEYLRYQKSTLEELVAFNDGSFSAPTASTSTTTQDLRGQAASPEHPSPRHSEEPPCEPQTTLDSEFPLNCLVFVRNVHSETNKTALRKIFHTALGTASASGLDYVDYIKGADTVCSFTQTVRPLHKLIKLCNSAISDSLLSTIHTRSWSILVPTPSNNVVALMTLVPPELQGIALQWRLSKAKGRRYIGRRCQRRLDGKRWR